ncbi:hypothetical protein A2U01_0116713 [Trifolium medium]|uniref:Uncharacterized protein n=1 Tax=Trifolium medium TaxID=97028 RepID=A0A392W982_9FABA|nr:hypothetical protein [Trifolium medium]
MPPRDDPTVVSEPIVIDLAPCIESIPDKGGQAAGPVEHSNGGISTSVWMKKASA